MNRRFKLQQEAQPAGSDAWGDGGEQNRGDRVKKGKSEESWKED